MPVRFALCLLLLSTHALSAQEPPEPSETPSMELLEFLAAPESFDEAWWEDNTDRGVTNEDDDSRQSDAATQD